MMNVNFFGTVKLVRTFVPLLKQCANSRVINVTSTAAATNAVLVPLQAYAASKSATSAFTHGLRTELRPLGIKVCEVRHWFFKTSIIDKAAEMSTITRQYNEASEEIKRDYGRNFLRAMAQFHQDFFESLMIVEDIDIAVDGIFECVVAQEPEMLVMVAGRLHPLAKLTIDIFPREITAMLGYLSYHTGIRRNAT